ncbi:hypothetical protein AUJ14_00135 [Candidatus Micrarchaeota archaeon CG1_02_55_22]|nr:MAG: hypothetical protein AUJ14_00135 [Candidatus Micrarchaeota archaeon CG1_02_55_22]
MATAEPAKLDGKGRVLIPSGMREYLRLKPDSTLLVSLDDANGRIIITPTGEKKLAHLIIGISDKPGSLARAAKTLADHGVDLITTESRSLSRGASAEWRVTCSADSLRDVTALKKALLANGATRFEHHKN